MSAGFWIIRVTEANEDGSDWLYGSWEKEADAVHALNHDDVVESVVTSGGVEADVEFVNDRKHLKRSEGGDLGKQVNERMAALGDHIATQAKRMVTYDQIAEGYKYEHDPVMCDKDQATVWVLHMRVHPDAVDAVLERMRELGDTVGFYNYGDSWEAWGETAQSDDDKHLAVYFRADRFNAYQVGIHLWAHAVVAASRAMHVPAESNRPITYYPAVSTAGDFAEQIQD